MTQIDLSATLPPAGFLFTKHHQFFSSLNQKLVLEQLSIQPEEEGWSTGDTDLWVIKQGGGVVPVSCWAAILSVLPQRESLLCMCSEDVLAVALTTVVLAGNGLAQLHLQSH